MKGLDAGSWMMVAVGLALGLRGNLRLETVPVVMLALPLIQWMFSIDYRSRVRAWFAGQWGRIETFSVKNGSIPWLAAAAFVAVPFLLFDLANGKTLGAVDTRPVVPTSVRLVSSASLDLSPMGHGKRDVLHKDDGRLLDCYQDIEGKVYSAFPPGMVPFATLVSAGARLCGAELDKRSVHIRLEKLSAAGVASVAMALFFLTACRLTSPQAAWTMSALLATGSAMFTTVGLGLWQHGGVALWLLAAMLVEVRGPRAWGVVAQGFALAMMLTCRPTAALLVVLFGTWVLVRDPKRAFAMAGVAVVAYLPCVAFYLSFYGNPVGPGTMNMNMHPGYWRFGRLMTMAGVLVCPSRGLFVYQPWAVLALFAWVPAARRKISPDGPRGWWMFCVVASLAHAFVISAWHDWSGGYCWGSRLLTEIVPLVGFLALGPVAAMLESRLGRAVLLGLGVLGFLVHMPAAFLDADRWNYVPDHDLWSWSNAPFFYRPE